MRRLGIVQPGRIGDIIICLPIAKWYFDRGYEVIWPVDCNIINNFKNYIDYVKFIPVNFDCHDARIKCLDEKCNNILDLTFNIQNGNGFNGETYLKQDILSFDEFKYYISNVPFEEKWNLKINRNIENEKMLLKKLSTDEPYVIVQEMASGAYVKVDWSSSKTKRIDIQNMTSSIFDWLGVFEKAEQHILIESCFSNLIDQLNIKVKKHTLLLKHGYYGETLRDGRLKGVPLFKLDWNRI